MSRFTINQVVPVIGFEIKFNNGNKNIGFSTPLIGDEVMGICIELLKCVSHHKVSSSCSGPNDDKTHDGFIFENNDGVVYHNQYPYAAYGQLNDSADSRFTRKIKPEVLSYWSLQKLDVFLGGLHRHIKKSTEDVEWYTQLEKTIIDKYELMTGHVISFKPLICSGILLDNWYEISL